MATTIVTEQFTNNLFSDPNGTRKTNPTIFDEIRWALQSSDKPLEQVLQLISEFHGTWTGMNPQLYNFTQNINTNPSQNQAFVSAAQSALQQLQNQPSVSTVGRQNNITASNMAIPLLREFVSRCQAIHPAINNFIQLNIGKYPFFQQISENVASFGSIVLSHTEVPPLLDLVVNGSTTGQGSGRLKRNTENKLYDSIKPLLNNVNILANTLFLRAMPVQNNMSLINSNYGSNGSVATSHGLSFCMDGFAAARDLAAMNRCVMNAVNRFGGAFQLSQTYFPVIYEVSNNPQFYNLQSEKGQYFADKLNRPIIREPIIGIASTSQKSTTS